MAKFDKKEVQLFDDKAFKALDDALTSGKYVAVPKIDQLLKFKDHILKLSDKGVSSEKITQIINDSGSGYRFGSATVRQFIAEHGSKRVVETAKVEAVAKPVAVAPVAAQSALKVASK